MALLQIEQLSFRVPARTVLDGLDLSVDSGEIHALVGANGAGKSTLAYLLMGCEGYRPDRGEIRFAGRRIDALPLYERARLGITLAWHEPARFEGLSVGDYLSLGTRKSALDSADCLRRVGLSPADYLGRMVDKTLSGGERKRIELASVLALNSRLVILDEPTAGIDLLSIQEIIDVIRRFKARGAAVLLITHHEAVTRIADRASLLDAGRIASSGDPEAVAARYRQQRPAYRNSKGSADLIENCHSGESRNP
jgi:Fe-S cluster assembly ATP-binding protein